VSWRGLVVALDRVGVRVQRKVPGAQTFRAGEASASRRSLHVTFWRELDLLGRRIRSIGGEADLLETTSPSPAWEEQLLARFDAARDAEYDEIVDSVEGFEDEIRRETRKKRFRFAELRRVKPIGRSSSTGSPD
jgi:hypothetical protein